MRRAIRTVYPSAEPEDDGSYRWVDASGLITDDELDVEANVVAENGRAALVLSTRYEGRVPYFWWVFDGLLRRSIRERLVHGAASIEAEARGGRRPKPPSRAWWAPPAAMSEQQVTTVATLSFTLALVSYGSSLLTQTVDYVANTFDATNAQLGVVTALTRVGTLVVIVGGALADRFGRRRLLLWSLGLVSVATVMSAAAPTLASFTVFQIVVRGAANLAFTVGFIAAVEEAPEPARAYTLAVVGIASGLGFVAGAILLPTADITPSIWRLHYLIGGLGLAFLPSISRRLTETHRYQELVARQARRGRLSEVVDRTYGGRFVLVASLGFLLNVFFAPSSQFTNRYLGDERGFSGLGILIVRAVTQAVPSFIAYYAGGRLAESSGRRRIAMWGLLVTAITSAMFFSMGGPMLWVTLLIATASGALAGPSLSAFNTELFPTEVRGTAGAGLTLAAVIGSAVGLLAVGYLADPVGSIGRATAITCFAPLIVAIWFVPRLPEARGKLLDEVSPPEV